jgi:hypothetical protein
VDAQDPAAANRRVGTRPSIPPVCRDSVVCLAGLAELLPTSGFTGMMPGWTAGVHELLGDVHSRRSAHTPSLASVSQ